MILRIGQSSGKLVKNETSYNEYSLEVTIEDWLSRTALCEFSESYYEMMQEKQK
jgi:hypothetical protein